MTIIISKLSLFTFLIILAYFLYTALITSPNEGDSIVYHIPIAQSIAKGELFNPPQIPMGLGYYPASAETILAFFIKTKIPLNLFGVFAWVCFFIAAYKLALAFELRRSVALIFASSLSMLPSVLRLLPTQTVDIWLAVFSIGVLISLKRLRTNLASFFSLGLFLGMLIGTKYSGLLFAAILILFYGRKLLTLLSFSRAISLVIPIFLLGLIWYIRNWFVLGNPFYPATLLFWEGNRDFLFLNWQPWKTLVFYPQGKELFMQAMISEFLIFSIAVVFVPLYLLYLRFKKEFINREAVLLSGIGLSIFGIYLFLPSLPHNLLSDLRYTYPSITVLMLVVFLIAQKHKKVEALATISLLNIISVFPQLDYHPKIIFFVLLTISAFLFIRNKF